MSDIWIVLVEDRHASVDARPFSDEQVAVDAARAVAGTYAYNPADVDWDAELTEGMRNDGWVLYLPYSVEGDCVRVVKRQMDEDPG